MQQQPLPLTLADLRPITETLESVGEIFGLITKRFDAVDTRFDAVDTRFDAMVTRFDAMDTRLKDGFEEVRNSFVWTHKMLHLIGQEHEVQPPPGGLWDQD